MSYSTFTFFWELGENAIESISLNGNLLYFMGQNETPDLHILGEKKIIGCLQSSSIDYSRKY